MKRFQTKLFSAAVVAGGLMTAGCKSGEGYSGHGDPCWPDRYANESRKAVNDAFQPQVENGHILDQTVWNQHFEYGSDKLNLGGTDKLDQLARRRPTPDVRVFLQTSRDIAFDAEKPADYAAKRVELDNKRVAAVQKYLKATLTGRELNFDIQIHDPAYPGIDVNPGVAPRVYVPAPGQLSTQTDPGGRAGGMMVPPVPVSGLNGMPAAGGGGAGGGARGGAQGPSPTGGQPGGSSGSYNAPPPAPTSGGPAM